MYGYLVGVVIVKNVGSPAFSMQTYSFFWDRQSEGTSILAALPIESPCFMYK